MLAGAPDAFRGALVVVKGKRLPWLFAAGSPCFDSYLIVPDESYLNFNRDVVEAYGFR